MFLERFYTNIEGFLEEKKFTSFKYETFYSTSNYYEGSVKLSSYKQRSMTTMKTQNKIVSKQFDGYFYNYFSTHFQLYFFENFKPTQFSQPVYIWEEQECGINGTFLLYNFFYSHYPPNSYIRLEKGKECKEVGFGVIDRVLENKNLPSFSLNFQLYSNKDNEYANESSFSFIERSIKSEEEQYLSLNRM